MLVDSHCHLFYKQEQQSLDINGAEDKLSKKFDPKYHTNELIAERAVKAGVTHIMSISTTLENSIKNAFRSIKGVSAAIGIHPDSAKRHISELGLETTIKELEVLADKAVCIGECGLDYHLETGDYAEQLQMFEAQIDLSIRLGLPLNIHARMAVDKVYDILKSYKQATGVMHCYSGSIETAKKLVDIGFLISFSGVLTFKSANDLREVARYLPEDSILVETDAPFLSPEPYRGTLNEPALVAETAKRLAIERNQTYEHICEVTSNNFFKLFKKCSKDNIFTGEDFRCE